MNNAAKLTFLTENYKTPAHATEIVQKTRPVFLAGISGAGKDAIKQQLLATGEFYHMVSHTTRAPRENNGIKETDGQDYHFISEEQAIEMLENQEFIEAKFVHGKLYGTSIAEFQKAAAKNKTPITDIDVQGIGEYQRISQDILPIFILPPSYEIWRERIAKRYTTEAEFAAEWQKRSKTAITELTVALHDADYYWLINDDLSQTVAKVLNLIKNPNHHDNSAALHVASAILEALEISNA